MQTVQMLPGRDRHQPTSFKNAGEQNGFQEGSEATHCITMCAPTKYTKSMKICLYRFKLIEEHTMSR